MTNNWRDTLTSYTPAYDGKDWAALNGRLQATTSSTPWKKGFLLTLLALLLFTSGFLVRGFLTESFLTEQQSIAVENTHSASSMNQVAGKPLRSVSQLTVGSGQQTSIPDEDLVLQTVQSTAQKTTPSEIPSSKKGLALTASNNLDNAIKSGYRSISGLATLGMSGNTRTSVNATKPESLVQADKGLQLSAKTPQETNESSDYGTVTAEQAPPKTEFRAMEYASNEDLTETLPLKDSSNQMAEELLDTTRDVDTSSFESMASIDNNAERTKSILTPEMREIPITFSPFYQTSRMQKRMFDASVVSEPEKAFAQINEVGLDMQLGKNLYAGLGYGYHFWNKKYAGVSQYRAHSPFFRVGISIPVLPHFQLNAQVGASVLIEKFNIDRQKLVDGRYVPVTEAGKGTGNIANYGIGASYSFKGPHCVYGLFEIGQRSFTAGYKYRLFRN